MGTLFALVNSKLPESIEYVFWIVLSSVCLVLSCLNSRLISHRRILLLSLFCLISGFLLANRAAQQLLEQYFLPEWQGKSLLISGIIADIPEIHDERARFVVNIKQGVLIDSLKSQAVQKAIDSTEQVIWTGGKIRLSWYTSKTMPQLPVLKAGQQWQWVVRLKYPNSLMNPGGFDYEKWLFSQRVVGTGYVRAGPKDIAFNQLIEEAAPWRVNTWRQYLHDALSRLLPDHPQLGLLQALLLAERSGVETAQWEVLRKTGTSHLIAISGLHIGLVAGFGFIPVWLLGMFWPQFSYYCPLPIAGAICGASLAVMYALLAGFNLPTQRALIMVLVLMVGLWGRRRLPFLHIWIVALGLVTLFDPLAALQPGFWLSFSAVLLIFLLLRRRGKLTWGNALYLQMGLSLLMIPLTVLFFGAFSLASPVANSLAIPVVTVLVVPLTLLGGLLLPLGDTLADTCWELAAWVLKWLIVWLEWLTTWPGSWHVLPEPSLPAMLLAVLGILCFLLPAGMPGRWLVAVFWLPLFWMQPPRPAEGDFRLTVLDVGQGLSSVVQTRHHTLVFDTGIRFSQNSDMGKRVVIPWLQSQAIGEIDTLLISHADRDHSGGVSSILAAYPVKRFLTSDTGFFIERWGEYHRLDQTKPRVIEACHHGQQWHWDGVDFQILHPKSTFLSTDRNERSCVLKVSNQQHSALLVADIERSAERWLLRPENVASLTADVLLVPHHGSKTSSSLAFLEAVNPDVALLSAGYRNRFHHPHPDVSARYAQQGIQLWSTIRHGAIRVDFNRATATTVAATIHITSWRKQQERFWHRHLIQPASATYEE